MLPRGSGLLLVPIITIITFTLAVPMAYGEAKCAYGPPPKLKSVWNDPVLGKSGPYDPGDYEKQLEADFWYVDCAGTKHIAKKGTVVNGASIPRGAWTLLGYTPWSGRSERPAIIHDHQCESALFTSDRVHAIFHEGLIASGVSSFDAALMYAAVFNFGPQWSSPSGPVTHPTYVSGFMSLIANLLRGRLTVTKQFRMSKTNQFPPRYVEELYMLKRPGNYDLTGSSRDREIVEMLSREIKKIPPKTLVPFSLQNTMRMR